jgi:hypothetical protein
MTRHVHTVAGHIAILRLMQMTAAIIHTHLVHPAQEAYPMRRTALSTLHISRCYGEVNLALQKYRGLHPRTSSLLLHL